MNGQLQWVDPAQQLNNDVVKLIQKFERTNDVPALSRALDQIRYAAPATDATGPQVFALYSLKLRLLLSLFNALDLKKDPTFKEGALCGTAMPPEETGLPAGVAPEAIKDPRLRAKYEADLAAIGPAIQHSNFQLALGQVEDSALETFDEHVAAHTPKAAARSLDHAIDLSIHKKSRAHELKARAAKIFAKMR